MRDDDDGSGWAHQQQLEQQQYEEEKMKVYPAIAKVMKDLAAEGISKSRKNTSQGYQFRGIDDVYNALSGVLSRHGLVMLPRILARTCEERATAKGGVLFYVTIEAEFDLVCAEDGSKHTIRTYGEAMDSGDKATNKAMSAAYKYAAMQAFCIPTEGDNDADATTHTVAPRSAAGTPAEKDYPPADRCFPPEEAQATKPKSPGKHKPTGDAWEKLSPDEQQFLQSIADEVIQLMSNSEDTLTAAIHLSAKQLDNEEKVALWTRFDSKQRAALKKAFEQAKVGF